jgi:hypothetical protein
MSELVLTNNASFGQLAAAMGMQADQSKAKASTLPRLRIDHSGVMGEEEVKGKKRKVEVVPAGLYKLDVPEKEVLFSGDVSIRLFNQRFMYKRFVKEASKSYFVKTIMALDLKSDLRDNMGGFNCGKPSGWIEDYKALPSDMQALIKSIKRVRVLFGMVEMKGVTNAAGEERDDVLTPFIWEVDNKDAFKSLGAPIAQMAKQNRLLPQHWIRLATEEKALPNGECYYLPLSTLDMKEAIPLTDEDQKIFMDFNGWIDNYNEYIIKAHNEARANGAGDEAEEVDADLVDEFVDVEVKEAA